VDAEQAEALNEQSHVGSHTLHCPNGLENQQKEEPFGRFVVVPCYIIQPKIGCLGHAVLFTVTTLHGS